MALVEERCYVLHAQYGSADFFAIYDRLGRKAQVEALGGLIGYFFAEVGELNSIVSLWWYASFEERLRRRAQLASLPEWQNYLKQVRPMIRTMNNRLLIPSVPQESQSRSDFKLPTA